MLPMSDEQSPLSIIYDGECPFCTRFVELYRIRKNVGRVDLINVRERDDLLQSFAQTGIDIDNGMVVKWNNRDYYGSDAVNLLALLGSEKGIFSKINNFLFRNPKRAKRLYPALVVGRKIFLKISGRKLIGES